METGHSRIAAAEDELVRVGEAARRLGVTPRTLHRWEAADPPKITPSRTLGGQRRYSVSEINRIKNGAPDE